MQELYVRWFVTRRHGVQHRRRVEWHEHPAAGGRRVGPAGRRRRQRAHGTAGTGLSAMRAHRAQLR